MPAETEVLPLPARVEPVTAPPPALELPAPAPLPKQSPRWQASAKRKWSRRAWRLGFGAALLALLTGGFVWLSALFAPPRGVEFVLVGSGYEQNLSVPHNVYGWNSLADLATAVETGARRSLWGRHFWHTRPEPQRLLTETDLTALAPQSTSRNWVLFISAHGLSDAKGAYLLAENDLAPDRPAPRISLTDLLSHVKSLPAEQHKVVVLDVVLEGCDIARGMLTNEFAAELQKLDAEVASIPNLVIVCSSRVDELSWSCPMWGRTTFAHFWIEGLRGAASDGNRSGRIDLAELMEFVSGQTNHWVSQYYRASQNPWMLPSGKAGLHRAKLMDLAWTDGSYEPSVPSLTPPASIPTELRQAWQMARTLSQGATPPYVYEPQTWRHYLATLARYEQLVLSGDIHSAERVGMQLQSLALRCQHDPTQLLSSLDTQRSSSAFAAPVSPKLRSRAQDVLQKLSGLPMDQWSDTWKQQFAAAGDDGKPLRAEVLQLLVEQAIADPPQRLAPVRHLAGIVCDPLQPLCPALHLIVMMERDLPDDARTLEAAPLIAHAIRVRQLAEQATTGDTIGFTQSSPRVRPWVAERIAKADALRQEAEDLLFAGAARHAQAEQLLTQAEAVYREAILDGGIVLQAYRMRDQASAVLPDISVAVLMASQDSAHDAALRPVAAQLERAWNELHLLADCLESPGQTPLHAMAADASANSLESSAARVASEMRKLEAALTDVWEARGKTPAAGERLCLNPIPSLPALDVDTREQAWERSLQYVRRRREDLTQLLTLAATGYTYAPVKPVETKAVVEGVQDLGTARGALALAMLGQKKYAALSKPGDDTWAESTHRLQVFRVDADWRAALTALANQVAIRWQRMPERIREDTEGTDAEKRTNAACIQADDLGRNLLPQFYTSLNDDASDDLRRRRLSGYLAWQAERSWRDHWYSARADETPYYVARARALLSDAERVSPLHNAFADLAKRIAANDDWDLQVPMKLVATREEALRLSGMLLPMHQETLGGFVSLRVAMGQGLKADGAPLEAAAWSPSRSVVEVPIVASVADVGQFGSQTVVSSGIDVAAFYRGRRIDRHIAVELHSTPDYAVIEPLAPPTGMVAVEVSPELTQQFGRGQGAVSVVLDCSGSMGPKVGQPFDASTRYAQASAALSTVLAGLPRGTQLSVWTFGQAVGAKKTVPDAEKTIHNIRPLSPWDPTDTATLQSLVKSFSYPNVEPWNESSVVHAMLSAKDELAKASGFKTMIVITDGIDNRFVNDKVANPQALDVATGLTEAFRGSNIAINVVGFQIASHEEQAARDQFVAIEALDPPGRFFSVDESSELIAALNAALDRRLRYWLEDFDHRTVVGESTDGWQPSLSTTALPRDRIGVPLGDYLLRVAAGRPIERPIEVASGDLIIAQIMPMQQGVSLERALVLNRLYPQAFSQRNAAWNAGVLQAALNSDSAIVTVALERNYDPTEVELAHVVPRDIWWELRLNGIEPKDAALRATRTYQAGLPAWQLTCSPAPGITLPTATSGTLTGWWLDDAANTSAVQLVAGRDFQRVEDLIGREMNVEGDRLVVRDARWEATSDGQQLVLVIDGSPHELVWARVRGIGAIAAEHRHYESLERYVGIFPWPAQASQDAAYRIEFGSVGQLKRAAEARGTHIQFEKLLLQRAPGAARP